MLNLSMLVPSACGRHGTTDFLKIVGSCSVHVRKAVFVFLTLGLSYLVLALCSQTENNIAPTLGNSNPNVNLMYMPSYKHQTSCQIKPSYCPPDISFSLLTIGSIRLTLGTLFLTLHLTLS